MIEEYRDIKGFKGYYQVSNLGNVKSLSRKVFSSIIDNKTLKERILKPSKKKDGYVKIGISKKGKRSYRLIHRLVAEAFLPKVKGKKYVNHIDGNKENNHVGNLEWCTSSENTIHAYENGLLVGRKGEQNKGSKLTDKNVLSVRSKYSRGSITKRKLADMFSVEYSTINNIIKRKSWKHI